MIHILDLGINNVASLTNSFADLAGVEVRVTAEPVITGRKDLIVLPGTGSFAVGMERLQSRGLDRFLRHEASAGTKILGICLGMHLLGASSDESPGISGLAIVPGATFRLESDAAVRARVPHVGWNGLFRADDCHFSDFDFEDGRDVYFSHSYAVSLSAGHSFERLLTPFGKESLTAGFRLHNILGLQFHPEKSSAIGRGILSDLMEWVGAEV